ncbi:MAG: glycosyl hydrolase [Marinilabiliales bacterium]|nr:MAG: glycosyl hydrolase [Marinilabiliales bacterium]
MKKLFVLAIILFSVSLLNSQNMNENLNREVEELLHQLTLEEKASLCSGRDDWSSQSIERLNIPWIWMSDGPHGLRRAPATNKPGYGDQLPATCFPTASALAASWDVDLIYDVGIALGEECQALDVNVLLGPGVNIKRSVLGGRNFEYFSEDPILSGEMGAAFINGVQSQGVGTSLKHFVANNVETMRMYANSDVDSRTLHEIYLKPFEIAVKKAQPWTIMACYNRVQGEYGTQSPFLLTKTLKNDWGFEGIVISDWFAVVDRVEGIKSGMHIEMPGTNKVNDSLIVEAVKNGDLKEEVLDNIVRDILRVVLKAQSLEKEDADQKIEEHHNFARKVVGESITLLKNENALLPISKDKYKTIAVIGEFAINPRYQGNGSSEVKPVQIDNVMDILREEYGEEYTITYSRGYDLKDDNNFTFIEDAVEISKKADIVLVLAGLPLHYESEGIDRTHINMPESHNKLIDKINKANEKTVVVLTNGSAVAMPWAENTNTVVESWLGGQAGAGGVVDVLFGKVNPSGKLAETFPKKLEDTPSFFNFPAEEGNVLYGERMFVGYRYYDEKKIEPLFPFGHGLSYTTFDYKNIAVSDKKITDTTELSVSVVIKNTGSKKGKEVIQLYLTDKESRLQRPKKELKRFSKVELNPGEEKEITFKLDANDFSYFDSKRNMWIAESGQFDILLGSSSRDIRQKETITLNSTQKVPLGFDEYTFFSEYWNNEETREFLKEIVPVWISQFVPEGKTMDEAVFQDFFIEHPLIKMPYITNGECSAEDIKELVKKSSSITFTP